MKLSYSSEMFKFHLKGSYYRVEMSFDSCLKVKYLNIKTKIPWNWVNKHKHILHLWGGTLPVIYCSYYLHTYQTKLACSYLAVFTQDSRSVFFYFLLDVSLSIHHPWEIEWKALTALKGLGQQRQRNGLKQTKKKTPNICIHLLPRITAEARRSAEGEGGLVSWTLCACGSFLPRFLNAST